MQQVHTDTHSCVSVNKKNSQDKKKRQLWRTYAEKTTKKQTKSNQEETLFRILSGSPGATETLSVYSLFRDEKLEYE